MSDVRRWSRRLGTAALTTVMLFSGTATAVAASRAIGSAGDSPPLWELAAWTRMHDLGVVKGIPFDDGSVREALDYSITRAQMVTMLVRALGQEENATILDRLRPGAGTFTDTVGHWAAGHVAMAQYIVEHRKAPLSGDFGLGRTATHFGPDEDVTVADAIATIMRFVGIPPAQNGDYIQGAYEHHLITARERESYTRLAQEPARRGLVFYLADQVFYLYDLPNGKTVYTTYIDTDPPTVTVDEHETTTYADQITLTGRAWNQFELYVGSLDAPCERPARCVLPRGAQVVPGPDGRWSKTVALWPGANEITVVARDRAGNASAPCPVSIIRAEGRPTQVRLNPPEPADQVAGPELVLTATVLDQEGLVAQGYNGPVAFSTSDPGVARVEVALATAEHGIAITVLRAVSPGTATLRAAVDRVGDSRLEYSVPVGAFRPNAATVAAPGAPAAASVAIQPGPVVGITGGEGARERMQSLGVLKGTGLGAGSAASDPASPSARAEFLAVVTHAFGRGEKASILADQITGVGAFADTAGHPASAEIAIARFMLDSYYTLRDGHPDRQGNALSEWGDRFQPDRALTVATSIEWLMRFLDAKPTPGQPWPVGYDFLRGAVAAGLLSEGERQSLAPVAQNPISRGLALYLADRAFYGYQLWTGKSVYRTYLDTAPPVLTVGSYESPTGAAQARLRGTTDGEAVTVESAGGKPAVHPDSAGGWGVAVPLAMGVNVVRLESTDMAGNSASPCMPVRILRVPAPALIGHHPPQLDALPDRVNAEDDVIRAQFTGAADADGDPLVWSASGLPPGMTMNAHGLVTGRIPFTAVEGVKEKAYAVTVTVTDQPRDATPHRGAIRSFTWRVLNTNRPPLYTTLPANRMQVIDEGMGLLALEATDPDGDRLTYSLVDGSLPPGLSLRTDGRFDGQAYAAGMYQVRVRVADGNGGTDLTTLRITVSPPYQPPPNRAPVAASQALVTPVDTPVTVTLTGSDPDGDHLTYTVVSGPAFGTLSGTAPNLTYTPSPKHMGPDSFTFRVNDGQVNSATATVTVTVEGESSPR